MSLSFSSRCMLELKFAIYYRTASLPSQASYVVLAEESQAFLKHSPHTNSISNSAILCNNYISLLSDLCACTWRKNGVVKEAIVLQWAVRIASCDFKPGKKQWAGALLSEKCCCFVQKPLQKSHANLTNPVWRRRRRKKNILAVWWLCGSVLSWCLLAPLGVLFVMKMNGRVL